MSLCLLSLSQKLEAPSELDVAKVWCTCNKTYHIKYQEKSTWSNTKNILRCRRVLNWTWVVPLTQIHFSNLRSRYLHTNNNLSTIQNRNLQSFVGLSWLLLHYRNILNFVEKTKSFNEFGKVTFCVCPQHLYQLSKKASTNWYNISQGFRLRFIETVWVSCFLIKEEYTEFCDLWKSFSMGKSLSA